MLPQVIKNVGRLRVHAVPCFNDNYAYLIEHISSKAVVAVDPAQADNVLNYLKQTELKLVASLTTHKHADHSGGNKDIGATFPEIHVYGDSYDTPPGCTKYVSGGDKIVPFEDADVEVSVTHVPCHTKGHVLYKFTQPEGDDLLFTGDTIFVAGCGRFFEGGGEDMRKIVYEALPKLVSDSALIFCGHEYTLSNIRFAEAVEPENEDVKAFKRRCQSLLDEGRPTIPSTYGDERRINPFLRAHEKSVQEYCLAHNDSAQFGLKANEELPLAKVLDALRNAKNKF